MPRVILPLSLDQSATINHCICAASMHLREKVRITCFCSSGFVRFEVINAISFLQIEAYLKSAKEENSPQPVLPTPHYCWVQKKIYGEIQNLGGNISA